MNLGEIIILNGAPRSGKSAIVAEIQKTFPGVWMNIGVDNYMKMTPPALLPGIGLRPGGERPDLEDNILLMYHALYQTIAAHSRMGINVVVDVSQHESYKTLKNVWDSCMEILEGLPVLRVGVKCDLPEILKRREATGYPCYGSDGDILPAIEKWQTAVHHAKNYDIILDTTSIYPEQNAMRLTHPACVPACATDIKVNI